VKLAGLVHLRALAITLVYLYHYRMFAHPDWIDRAGAFGWSGVDLFFVLSGFLISRQLLRGPFSLQEFYFKRLLRIQPAYLVVLAAYFCFPSMHEREALPPLWKFLTFTQNFGLDVSTSGTFSHAWSLCIEEQFYLLLPLVLLVMPRVWLLPLLIACGVGARALVHHQHVFGELSWFQWIYYPTWARLDGLLVGIALAALEVFRPALWARLMTPRLLPPALLLWLAAAFCFVEPESLFASLLAFPAIAAVYGLLMLAAVSRELPWRVTDALATLSYSLYLTHKATTHVVQRLMPLAPDGNAMFVVCVGASLAAALTLHLVVERPFLRWRDARFASARRPG
jgi:peptidoglycan/LPS O-acetylase OafA/YrhL